MTKKDDYSNAVRALLTEDFESRFGTVVPTTDSVTLKNGGVYLHAVYLYADMSDSTGMARRFTDHTAAKIVRAFLAVAARIIRHRDGEIRSYDGDRVMAIFIGTDAATRAAKAALELKWVVDNVVRGGLSLWLDEYYESDWVLSHRCGLDTGDAFIVRAGVRDSNDLVSIGDAPNIAARLSELKGARTFITDRMWDAMSYDTCFTDRKPMWSDGVWTDLGGGRLEKVRSSSWGWIVS